MIGADGHVRDAPAGLRHATPSRPFPPFTTSAIRIYIYIYMHLYVYNYIHVYA